MHNRTSMFFFFFSNFCVTCSVIPMGGSAVLGNPFACIGWVSLDQLRLLQNTSTSVDLNVCIETGMWPICLPRDRSLSGFQPK